MKECVKDKNQCNKNKSFIGVIFLIVGIVLLGRNFNFIPWHISNIVFSWPMLLVAIGIVQIAMKKKTTCGLFMIGIGGIFLWNRIYPFSPIDWHLAWPAVFIFVGLAMVVGYLNKPKDKKQISEPRKKAEPKKKKNKHDDVEFDIDKIEPIED